MNRRTFLHTAALGMALAGCRTAGAGRAGEPLFEGTTVFAGGEGGYPVYRIPALVQTGGTLLAFAEGRQEVGDHASNDLVLRRSTDGGRSWDAYRTLLADGDNVLVNPCPVVLPSGRVLLVFQRYPAGYHERAIGETIRPVTPGLAGPTVCTTHLMTSDDRGRTWSAPRDITAGTKRPDVVLSTASGPGIGIVLKEGPHRGRIVIPTNEAWFEGPRRPVRVYAAYSDDEGESWSYGEPAPDSGRGHGDEVQMAEVDGGELLLNTRSGNGNHRRKVARSRDGGLTWTPLADDPTLIEPECQGTLLRYEGSAADRRMRILFANPAATDRRGNGTVRVSFDGGHSWPVSRVVEPAFYAYSCLTELPDRTLGLLYEADEYRRIAYVRFDLAWLEAGPATG